MYRCKSCGEEIDEYQFTNFNQSCSKCTRNSKGSSQGSPITAKIFQLTVEVEGRKENHWTIYMFVWFMIAGGIASSVMPPEIIMIAVLIFIVGIIGVIASISYRQKTQELENELKQLIG